MKKKEILGNHGFSLVELLIIVLVIGIVSAVAIPVIFLGIVVYGVIEKKQVYDSFLDGAKEGIEIVVKIFPTFSIAIIKSLYLISSA